jgi:hypothetical protein
VIDPDFLPCLSIANLPTFSMSEILKDISKKHIYQKEFSNVYPV